MPPQGAQPAPSGTSTLTVPVPGGAVRLEALDRLGELAGRYGAPVVEITDRCSLRLHLLPTPVPAELLDAIRSTGLAASIGRQGTPTVIAAPLAPGLVGIARDLAGAIRADPALAQLPDDFAFVLSDLTGSALGEPYHVAYQQFSADAALILAAGRGRPVAPADALAAMLSLAHSCVAGRAIDAADDEPIDLAPAVADWAPIAPSVARPLVPGPVGPGRAHLVVGLSRGALRYEHVRALRAVATDVVLTPWRSILVPFGARHADDLAAAGFLLAPDVDR